MASRYEGLKEFLYRLYTIISQCDVKHMKRGPIVDIVIVIAGMWQYTLKK